MKRVLVIFAACFCLANAAPAQQKPVAKHPASKPVNSRKPSVEPAGTVSGRTFTSEQFRFSITFPDTWLIPGDDFDEQMREKGFDLSLKAPSDLGPVAKARMDQSLKNVKVLTTAYRAMPGTTDNAIMRVSAEDLSTVPQVRDAVDYFDLMRRGFQSMRLPADFKYSETQAEQLGRHQFAFIDVSSSAGKKRMYATVRNGYAIMFTLSYTRDDDLRTMRQILTEGNFSLK